MKKITSFQVLDYMATNNEDIKLASLSNIIAGDKKGNNHTLTIGVDAQTFNDWMNGKEFVGGLIFADRKRFKEIEKTLSAE